MLTEYIQPITSWLKVHPHWSGLFAFVIAFTESLAIIGSLIPGSVTLIAIGILIGVGVSPFALTLISAMVGGFLGDAVSYWLGGHFHQNLRSFWPFSKYPQLISKGERFFERHGGKSIFIGRFVGPIRAILPLVAGMLDMKLGRFLFIDFVSSLVWAPTYIVPGIIIGAASIELSPAVAEEFIISLFLILVLLFCISWLIKYLFAYSLGYINRFLDRAWVYLRTHKPSHFITTLLQDPSHPEGHGQLVLAFSLFLSASLFILLTLCVKYTKLFIPLNETVFHVLQSVRTLKLDQFMLTITFIGEIRVLSVLLGVVTLWLVLQRNTREACYWLLNGVLGMVLATIVRIWVKSPRPLGLTVVSDTFSYPSGHATLSTVILGFLAVLIAKQCHRDTPKSIVFAPFTIMIILIAFSRIFLGAHWLTDVVGGLLLGLSCVMFSTIALQRQIKKPINLLSFCMVSFVTLIITWGYYLSNHFETEMMNNQPYFPVIKINYPNWKNQIKPLLPLYRSSRIGKPIETLNIQWAGQLDDIEDALTQRGWSRVEIPSLVKRLQCLVMRNKMDHASSVFDKLYQLQRPSLTMTKTVAGSKSTLTLRLWPSRFVFSDNKIPLWIGNIQTLDVLMEDLGTIPHRMVEYDRMNLGLTPNTVNVVLIYQ